MNDTDLLRELVAGRRWRRRNAQMLERALPIVHRFTAGSVFAAADVPKT